MNYARLVSTAKYLPKNIVSNDQLADKIDTTNEWIVKRTGISQRHITAEGETSLAMACIAAREALAKAEVKADYIDAIIVATCTHNKPFPSLACGVGQSLGVGDCFAMDLNAACSGTLYALELVYQNMFVPHGWKNVLVLGVDRMTHVVDWQDRGSCVLFGDGAGALLFTRDTLPGIEYMRCGANGDGGKLLYAESIPNADPKPAIFPWGQQEVTTKMSGKEVFKHATHRMAQASQQVLEYLNYTPADISWCVPHQANKRILDAVCNKLKLEQEKLICTVSSHANTSAASIPLALDDGFARGIFKQGDKILCNAFGAGFTWGAGVLHVT